MVKNNIRVSVVVPIYNKERYLCECVESVRNQSYKNIEIVLVDDGSTDNSGLLCDEFKKKDARITVIHQKNAGVSAARQRGVKETTGNYVMFIDGDDWIDQNCIETMVSELVENRVDLVCCGYSREHSGKKFETHIFDSDTVFRSEDYIIKFYRRFFGIIGNELSAPEKADSIVSCCMKIYPRDVLDKGWYVDHREVGSCEDALLNITTLIYLNSAKYIDKCFYHYRKDNRDSITYTYRPKLITQWSILYNYMEDLISKYNLPPVFNKALQNRIALSTIGYGLTEISAPNKSYLKKVKTFREVLNRSEYRAAFQQLEFKYISGKWKIYFLLCKYRFCSLLIIILKVMQFLRRKKAS